MLHKDSKYCVYAYCVHSVVATELSVDYLKNWNMEFVYLQTHTHIVYTHNYIICTFLFTSH